MVIRPAVLIAYGDPGREWLKRLEQYLRKQPPTDQLVADHVVQLWAVGTGDARDGESRVTAVSPSATGTQLQTLLDRARRARHGDRHDPRVVYVFERWSLFGKESAVRPSLRTAMDVARRIDCAPGGAAEFQYRWLSMVDACRSAGPVDAAQLQAARDLIRDCANTETYFLIDRADGVGGRIDRDAADGIYSLLCRALMGPCSVFRDEGAGDPVPELDPAIPSAIPVSVVRLRHSPADVVKARTSALLARLRGNRAVQLEDLELARAPRLADVIHKDLDGLTSGEAKPGEVEQQRVAAVEGVFRRAMATGDGGALREISAARMVLQQDGGHTSVPAVAALQLASVEWEWGLALVAAVGSALALWWALRGRRRLGGSSTQPAPVSQELLRECREEWSVLLQALDAVLRSWRTAFRPSQGTADLACWEVKSTLPVTCTLVTDPSATSLQLDGQLYQTLARECTRLLLSAQANGLESGELVREAVQRIVGRIPVLEREVLQTALSGTDAEPLRRVIRSSQLSVNVGRPMQPETVSWFWADRLAIGEAIEALEPPATRHITHHFNHGSDEFSLRVAFGPAVPWTDVLSLSSIVGDG